MLFFFKQKTAYEMRISDCSSDVCSSDLRDFYLKPGERNEKLQAAYLQHLENMLTLAGETNAAARAQAIYDLEKSIATVHWDKNDSSDATKVYNKMTSEERRVGKTCVSKCRYGVWLYT